MKYKIVDVWGGSYIGGGEYEGGDYYYTKEDGTTESISFEVDSLEYRDVMTELTKTLKRLNSKGMIPDGDLESLEYIDKLVITLDNGEEIEFE